MQVLREVLERIRISNPSKRFNYDISQEFINAISKSNLEDSSILRDVTSLRSFLVSNNVPEIDIGRFSLIVSVPGFNKMLDDASSGNIDRVVLDAFVVNAYEQTGLLKFLILEYLSVVFESRGILYPLSFTDKDSDLARIDHGNKAFYYPYSSYKSILDTDGTNSASFEGLISMGIPMAYYLKGKNQLETLKEDADADDTNENALEDIRTASLLGCGEASLYLGRYYFDLGPGHWEKAYDYYSSCGIDALSEKDRENIISLMNFRQYNKTMLIFGSIMWILTFLLVCIIPSFSYYSGQIVYGIVTLVLQGIILGGGFFFHKKMPHTSKALILFLIFVLLMCFVIVRLLF